MSRPKKLLEDIDYDGWDMLEALSIWGTAEFCAEKLSISPDTLDRRLKEKYDHGFAEYKRKRQEPMRVNLMKKQYDTAMQGNVTMLIWLGKQYLGQSDKQEAQITGKIGIEITPDESKL